MNPLLADHLRPPSKTPKTSRREARENVLQILYAYEFTGDNIHKIIEDIAEPFAEPTMSFVRELALRTIQYRDELDRLIQSRAENWDFERIAIIDRILLRMGICEFLYFEDVPPKVSINEVIEISKRYSTEKSSKFVNGILDSIFDDLKKTSRLRKTGRGIVNK
jgi:N utilization substance protein B